jgi:cytochrome P450
MNHYAAHSDPILFPSPHDFIPDRWLNNPKAPELSYPASKVKDSHEAPSKPLSRYMVSFMKGTRSCLGMHLANAELYIMLANLVRRVEMELYETEYDDVGFVQDMFVPRPKPGSKGLRVIIKGKL